MSNTVNAQANCGGVTQKCCAGGGPNPCNPGLQCNNGICLTNNPAQGPITTPTKENNPNITCDPAGGAAGTGINTAIGCVPALGKDSSALSNFLLNWAIGIGGGIAFLLILYSGFMIMTSSGDPQRLKAGQELLTAAISGVVMLIFAVFILRFIGVNILGI